MPSFVLVKKLTDAMHELKNSFGAKNQNGCLRPQGKYIQNPVFKTW
jgi:hypothetical protein